MSKPKFSSLELPKPDDKSLDDYVAARGAPVLKSVQSSPTDEPVKQSRKRPKPEAPKSMRTHSIRTEVPDYLAKQLRLRAAERDCTIRFLLLEALKENGFAVDEADLMEDGRRNSRVN